MNIKRRKTRQIKVGRVRVGSQAPISIQSMTNCPTSDVRATVAQIRSLTAAGCEIVRVSVKDDDDAAAIRQIRRRIAIPLVADIHFNYRLALAAIEVGADKVRINPGNIWKHREIAAIAKSAKKAGIPIRVGVNSGSVSHSSAASIVRAALNCAKLLEEHDFHDIIVSLKASDVVSTVEAYRKMAAVCDYPMHLGVTAAGTYESGIVKSAAGIGCLVMDGIGDTVRVSLTADPVKEVDAAKRILGCLKARRFGPDIISCPTCGRCQVDLIKIVGEFERRLAALRLSPERCSASIAIMGCEVNGPGEAREADIGIAFGRGSGVLFKNGRIIRKVSAKEAVRELLSEL